MHTHGILKNWIFPIKKNKSDAKVNAKTGDLPPIIFKNESSGKNKKTLTSDDDWDDFFNNN